MERGEKALVPEWLKGANGSTAGGGGSTPHHSASSSQSDDHGIALPTRSRSSSVSSGDHDSPRSAFAERISSSYFRRSSSSNGAMMHDKDPTWSHSSFGRSHRERDWEKDLDLRLGDHDISDSLTLTSRIDKETLRRSQSMISGKRGEVWPRRVGNDTSNGFLVGGNIMSNIHKAAFERDFPSLGVEEKLGVPDICRVSSPGLSSASQSLQIGTSGVIGGEGWTSALAELPVTVGSSSTGLSSVQQAVPASSACVAPSATTGLNMAETLAQAPARPRTTPQFTVETQRLEELAIKQSRQLIPMTPSLPKTSVLNSTEKPKSKTVRSSELIAVAKVGQASSSQLVNHSVRGTTRSDVSKASQAGKLTVLKAAREKNDVSPTAKDGLSPTNASRVWSGVTQSAAFAPLRSPVNPQIATDRKASASSVTQSSFMDRRQLSQAQNRSDFFNSLRKKTANHLPAIPDSIPVVSSVSEKSNEQITAITASVSEGTDAPASGPDLEWSPGNDGDVAGNGNACKESEIFSGDGEKDLDSDAVLYPDEEEAAFLRSMGWEENAEAAAPITEEEINDFYELLKLRPSPKLSQGTQQSKIMSVESHVGSLGGSSSGLSSSDSEDEV